MLSQILKLFSAIYYVRANTDRIVIRDVRAGSEATIENIVGISPEQLVVSVGLPTSLEATRRVNPLADPEGLISDGQIARLLLQFAFARISGRRLLQPSSPVVFQTEMPQRRKLSATAEQHLADTCIEAGARKVIFYYGSPLSDTEALEISRMPN